MPRQFQGARVTKRWIEARKQWRVIVIYPDQMERVRHFAAGDPTMDRYIIGKEAELRRLGEVTFDKAIDLYERERMRDRVEKIAKGIDEVERARLTKRAGDIVAETSRRLRELFRAVINSRIGGLTDKRAKELYAGKLHGDGLVEHGLVNRPTLRRAKHETPRPCRLACKCPHDGPPLKPDSHRNYLAEGKTFMRWCVRKEFAGSNPLEGVSGEGSRSPGGLGRNRLARKELRALYREAERLATDERDEGAVAVLMALLFGLRATEVVTRQVRHVDEETWTLEVDPDVAKTDASDRDNVIPEMLRPVLVDLMKDKRPGQYLLGDGDRPHWRDWVTERLHTICTAAGVPKVHAHSLRGAHEDLAKAAGETAAAICEQLGHREARTGERSYTSAMGRAGARRAKQGIVFDVLKGGKAEAS